MTIDAIGCHIYAGGFTLGIGRYFNVLAHLEHAGYGTDVIALNFPGLPVYTGGPKAWPRLRARLVYANPPCAIWSGAANGGDTHWRDDPRLSMHNDIFNYAMDIAAPDALVIESVPLSFTKGRDHVDDLIRRAESYGYAATIVAHDTKWLGVPQARRRIFYVFHKVAIPWEPPAFAPALTVREAFATIPKESRGHKVPTPPESIMKLLRLAGPGENLQKIYKRLNPNPELNAQGQRLGSPSFLRRRLDWDKPAGVMMEAYHPVENRHLTQEEYAALCSYPPDYRWPKGSQNVIKDYMNRGIMPRAAEWLGAQLFDALEANQRLNDLSPQLFDVTTPPGGLRPLEHGIRSVQQVREPMTLPRLPDEKSGAFIRRLLVAGVSGDTVLAAVHAQFEGSKATKADIAWHKGKLKKENGELAKPAAPVIVSVTAAPKANGDTPRQRAVNRVNDAIKQLSERSRDLNTNALNTLAAVIEGALAG